VQYSRLHSRRENKVCRWRSGQRRTLLANGSRDRGAKRPPQAHSEGCFKPFVEVFTREKLSDEIRVKLAEELSNTMMTVEIGGPIESAKMINWMWFHSIPASSFACCIPAFTGIFQTHVGINASDSRFSLPPNRYFHRHHLPPAGETSRYSPRSSNSLRGFSPAMPEVQYFQYKSKRAIMLAAKICSHGQEIFSPVILRPF
jgi:hypothetical protein